jgi:hypothetical protein
MEKFLTSTHWQLYTCNRSQTQFTLRHIWYIQFHFHRTQFDVYLSSILYQLWTTMIIYLWRSSCKTSRCKCRKFKVLCNSTYHQSLSCTNKQLFNLTKTNLHVFDWLVISYNLYKTSVQIITYTTQKHKLKLV